MVRRETKQVGIFWHIGQVANERLDNKNEHPNVRDYFDRWYKGISSA